MRLFPSSMRAAPSATPLARAARESGVASAAGWRPGPTPIAANRASAARSASLAGGFTASTSPNSSKKAAPASAKKGIQVRVTLMIGNPGDTYKTAMNTIKWVRDNPNIDAAEFALCTAYPNTPLWKWVKENGKVLVDSEHYPTYFLDKEITPAFDTPDFPAEERVKALRIAQKQMARKFAFKNKSLKNFKIRSVPKYISTIITITLNRAPKRKFRVDKK